MRITHLDAFPIRLSRDLDAAGGSAGSPARLDGEGEHRWASTYPCLYSTQIETALVRVRLANGIEGWGEAQAPIAPEVACAIIERILRPAICGESLDPGPEGIARLWDRMYASMRVRGQTGGFMLDAISGTDLALWDASGKLLGVSAREMLGASRDCVDAYLSGIPGERWEEAARWHERGITSAKVYYRAGLPELAADLDRAESIFGNGRVAVDALWRLDETSAPALCGQLDERQVLFLECPFPPEETGWYMRLAQNTRTPLAAGESYRTFRELRPLFDARALRYVQPDLGRSGITEALRIAREAARCGIAVIPHVSIALGPQLAAAIHFSAAVGCPMLEFNPGVVDVANRYLETPLQLRGGSYVTPDGPGLGIELTSSLHEANLAS